MSAPNVTLDEAFRDVLAHLVGAASAYRKYARRFPKYGVAETDPFFSTRADDFDKAVERGREAYAALAKAGGAA